jgi:hypothetical protein
MDRSSSAPTPRQNRLANEKACVAQNDLCDPRSPCVKERHALD